MMIFQHQPHRSPPKIKCAPKEITNATDNTCLKSEQLTPVQTSSGVSTSTSLLQPTWDESITLLTHHYIPKDELPFVSCLDPSMSRICGGWVQALPHVSQGDASFERILLPAVRALTLAMMITNANNQQEYRDTYGAALKGIRSVLTEGNELVDNTVAIAGMCLTLSEVSLPTR